MKITKKEFDYLMMLKEMQDETYNQLDLIEKLAMKITGEECLGGYTCDLLNGQSVEYCLKQLDIEVE